MLLPEPRSLWTDMCTVLSWLLFVSVAKLKLCFPDQLAALLVRFGLVDTFVSLPQAVSLAFDASIESVS